MSTTDSGLLITVSQNYGSNEMLTDWCFISFTPHITCFIIRIIQYTTFYINCGGITVTAIISFAQSSEISEHVSTYNSHKKSPFFKTFPNKAMIPTEGSHERKYRGISIRGHSVVVL